MEKEIHTKILEIIVKYELPQKVLHHLHLANFYLMCKTDPMLNKSEVLAIDKDSPTRAARLLQDIHSISLEEAYDMLKTMRNA